MTADSTRGAPADPIREALKDLRRPFAPEAVKWKVQALGKQGPPYQGLVVPYVDARLVSDRLNHVLGQAWSDAYELHGREAAECRLTVHGVTRADVGEDPGGEQGGFKAIYSDAFKRAAVKFGVGASLYALPKVYVEVETYESQGKTKAKALSAAKIRELQDRYRIWTARPEIVSLWGEPLGHGDVAENEPPGPKEIEDVHH